MKFLVDVNASGATVSLLEAMGHDVAQLVQIAFSLYQTCWTPMRRQPFDRLKVKLSTSLALLRRDAAGTGVTFFARQIQWLAPLGEPSGAYEDGLRNQCSSG